MSKELIKNEILETKGILFISTINLLFSTICRLLCSNLLIL